MARPRILRYEVPVDGDDHAIQLTGAILHVSAPWRHVVEFWALSTETEDHGVRCYFQVFGTGQEIGPAAYRHVGTAIVPIDQSIGGVRPVWHLMERV
jgi:hypothetical protein